MVLSVPGCKCGPAHAVFQRVLCTDVPMSSHVSVCICVLKVLALRAEQTQTPTASKHHRTNFVLKPGCETKQTQGQVGDAFAELNHKKERHSSYRICFSTLQLMHLESEPNIPINSPESSAGDE